MSNALKRVLVVEDNIALREVVRFNLVQAGFEVAVARNGLEAWQAIDQCSFDMVVTDQQMPIMTGYELCQRMRQDPRHVSTPILMLTAKGFELDARRLREELGVHDVIVKPFSPRALVRTIENFIAAISPVA
jgi:CheY-like chemotaxis protein